MKQELSPGPVIQRIWDIYRGQAGVLLPVAILLFAVQFVLAVLIGGALGILLTILFFALSMLYQGMVVQLVRDVQDGRRDSSVGDLLRSVQPVILPLMGIAVLFAIGVSIGFILLIIPGLFLITIWCVVAPVEVIERPGVFASFTRSRELVRGHGWEVFSIIAIVFLGVMVVSIIAALLADGLGDVGRALVQWVVNVLLAPVTALSAAVIFFSLKEVRGDTAVPAETAPAGTTAEPPFA
jgi:hypothetical protein